MTERERFNQLTGYNPITFSGYGIVKRGDYCPCGSMVYFLYTLINGHPYLIYVGQTRRGYLRIEEHLLYSKLPVEQWCYIPVPSSMLDEVERYYIQSYRPILNLVDNPDFIKEDGHYIGNKAQLHDIKRERLALLSAIKERERQLGHGTTDMYHMWTDEEIRDLAHSNISPDITFHFHGGR